MQKLNHLTNNIKALINIFKDARKNTGVLNFLLAYTLYNDGVQAVIVLSALFASAELKLEMEVIILAILIVQFIAVLGAIIFNLIAKYTNNLFALKSNLMLWIAAIMFAFFILYSKTEFYIMCCIVGLVMGGTQAISRSIYSQLIPANKEAEYFSIYELSEKGTSWLGPLIFAIIYNFTTSYRLAILSLALFFLLGFIILQVNKKKLHKKICKKNFKKISIK